MTVVSFVFGIEILVKNGRAKFLKLNRPDLPLIFEHLPFEYIPAAIERVLSIQAAGF